MTPADPLTEFQMSSTQLVDGLLLKAWRDDVRLPNGKTAVREYIRHPGAVIMVPVLSNGDTILVRQFRYPCGQSFLECPAGKLDLSETKENAARRELEEETGFTAGKIEFVAEYYPCIGYSNEKMWLYVATELTPTSQATDHDEFLELHRMPLDAAVEMARTGKILDLKSIAGLLLADHFLKQRNR